MSLAVVLVADDAVALAADSVYVEVTQDGAVVPASLRRKVFGVGDYAGALTGVATYEGHDFTVDLADACRVPQASMTLWPSSSTWASRRQAISIGRMTPGAA